MSSDRLFPGPVDGLERADARDPASSIASGSSAATLRDEVDGSTDTCAWFTPQAAARLHLAELARRALRSISADRTAATAARSPRRRRPPTRPAEGPSDAQHDHARHRRPGRPRLRRSPVTSRRWERLLPHYARSRAVDVAGGRLARRRLRGAPAVPARGRPRARRCRSRGARAPGASRRPAACGSSTSPGRRAGWT